MSEEKLVPKLRFSGFTDEWKKSNLGNISSNEMYGMNSAAKDYDGFNKYIRITDISETSNKFIPNPLTSPDGYLEDKYKLKKGDIVFARTGASTGKTYLYDDNDRNLYLILAGTNLNNLKNSDLEKFKFNIPTNESEINKIHDLFVSIDNKIDYNKKQLEEITLFKKGLLQQMFVVQLILSLLQNKKHI